jgi:hypothetical protein
VTAALQVFERERSSVIRISKRRTQRNFSGSCFLIRNYQKRSDSIILNY